MRGPDGKTHVHWDDNLIDRFTADAQAARDKANDSLVTCVCAAAHYMHIGALTLLTAAKLVSIVRRAPALEDIARLLSSPGRDDAKR